jgi:hypothetical protein
MSKDSDHPGSGLDKPEPKTVLEKLSDGVRSVLPKKPDQRPAGQTGVGVVVPPADRGGGTLFAWRPFGKHDALAFRDIF